MVINISKQLKNHHKANPTTDNKYKQSTLKEDANHNDFQYVQLLLTNQGTRRSVSSPCHELIINSGVPGVSQLIAITFLKLCLRKVLRCTHSKPFRSSTSFPITKTRHWWWSRRAQWTLLSDSHLAFGGILRARRAHLFTSIVFPVIGTRWLPARDYLNSNGTATRAVEFPSPSAVACFCVCNCDQRVPTELNYSSGRRGTTGFLILGAVC